MIRLIRVFMALSAALFWSQPSAAALFGGSREEGGRPGAFLDYSASARSLAMGRAHTAVADDASASYWNPAGLTQIERNDVVAMYSTLAEESGFGAVSFAHPTRRFGTFGLGIVGLRSAGFDRVDEDGRAQGEFSSTSNAFLLSGGARAGKIISLGGTLKAVREQVDGFSGSGVGLDAGLMAHVHPQVQLGVSVRNLVAPRVKLDVEDVRYPVDARAGVKYSPVQALAIAVDAGRRQGESVGANIGVDWLIADLFSLRAGLSRNEFAAGFGVSFGDWALDYAFGYHTVSSDYRDFGGAHRFGLHFNFGDTVQPAPDTWGQRRDAQETFAQLKSIVDHAKGDFDAAAETLARRVNRFARAGAYPAGFERHQALGYAAYVLGDTPSSSMHLARAAALRPADTDVAKLSARMETRAERERVRRIAEREMEQVRELYEVRDWESVIKVSEKVLAISPTYAPAKEYKKRATENFVRERLSSARQSIGSRDYVSAYIHAKKASTAAPTDPEAAKLLARIERQLEKRSAPRALPGETVGGEVVDRASVSKGLDLYNQGLRLQSAGQLQAARETLRDALKYSSGNSVLRDAIKTSLDEIKAEESGELSPRPAPTSPPARF